MPMAKAFLFLTIVQRLIRERGRTAEYLRTALKVAGKIPESVSAGEAAEVFLRWYYREASVDGDEWLRAMVGPPDLI